VPSDPKRRKRFVAKTAAERKAAYGHVRQAGARCVVCQYEGGLTAHHFVPRSQGGDDLAVNIVPIHHEAHMLAHEGDPRVLNAIWFFSDEEQRRYARERFGHERAEVYYKVREGRPEPWPAPCPLVYGR
jgi:hypothetical protein